VADLLRAADDRDGVGLRPEIVLDARVPEEGK
jgi:hypothetical protein